MDHCQERLYRIVGTTAVKRLPTRSKKMKSIYQKPQPKTDTHQSPRYNIKLCIVCFDETMKKDRMVTPCNHLCLCSSCAEKIKNKKEDMRCPYCNLSAEDIVQIYIV